MRSVRRSASGQGLSCLCNDGVYRTFSSTRAVVDAVPLNNKEIQSSLHLFPIEAQQQVQDIFQGVNGYTVAKEKLLCPDYDVLPKELRRGS